MSSPHSPDLRWVLVLVISLLVVLFLTIGTQRGHGQTISSEALNGSEQLLEQLILRLQERQAQAEQLQADLEATSKSLDALSLQFSESEKNWLIYRTEVQKELDALERERDRAKRWAVGFGVSTAVGFILSVILALQ